MTDQPQNQDRSGVDKSLIAMFLKMTPEERLKANDNAVRAIWELKHAYRKRRKHPKPESERNH
jgi:hypothetical protein